MVMPWDFIEAAGLVWKRFGSGIRTASQSVISAGYYKGAERLKRKKRNPVLKRTGRDVWGGDISGK
jgi:hypothetical protein